MAIGGPYTDQALGKAPIPLSELIGGGQQPAPDMGEGLSPDMGLPRLMQDDTAGFDPVVAPENMPLPGAAAPDSSVAEQGVAPSPGQREPTMAEQERQRPRMGGMRRGVERAPWNQDYRYTQEDFYGTDNPNITFTDPRGVQLYVPQAGRLPMSIWASQMQQAQGELAKTRKAMADLLDQTKAPQTAPPYQQDFNRLFYGIHENQISDLAKQYGGDRMLALQEMYTPGTEANMQYRRTMADAEALATFMKYEWEDASSWIKEVSEGKYEPYPEMRKTAEEVVHGLGSLKSNTVSGGDVGKLMQNIGKLRRDMALAKFTDEFLRPNAANLYQKTKEIIAERVNRDLVRTESLTEQNIQEEFYKVAADEYARFAPGADKKRAIEFFKAMFPADKEHLHEVKYTNLPKPNGDSGARGGANTPIGARIDATPVPQPKEGVKGIEEWKRKSMYEAPSMRISTKVGNEWRPIEKVDVTDASGSYRMMLQPRFTWKNGEYVIAGKMLDRTSELAITNALKSEGIDYDPAKSTWDNLTTEQATTVNRVVNKYTKNEAVPLRYNMDILSSKSGYRSGDEMLSALLAEAGHKVSPQQAGEMISTDKGRLEINRMLGFVKDEVPGASQKPMGNQAAGKSEAQKTITFKDVKARVPSFTQKDYDEAMRSEEGRRMIQEMFK